MNIAVFMSPTASAQPARPLNCPDELREVPMVRNLTLKTLQREGCTRDGLPLSVHITSSTVEDDHVVYHATMEGIVTKHKWVVSYRYSEFLAFKNQVDELYTCQSLKCCGSCQAIRDFVAECFPKKRLAFSTSNRTVADRKHKLETVLHHLLRCVMLPGSAMKCITARRVLPDALFDFLGVKDDQDRRSLLQIYVDNQNLATKRLSDATASSSSRSSMEEPVDDEVTSDASTWDYEDDDLQCVICLEDLDAEASSSSCSCDESSCGGSATSTITLPCHHSFHRECVFEWLMFEYHCPLCRTQVGPNAVTNFCRPKSRVQWWLGEFAEDPLASSK